MCKLTVLDLNLLASSKCICIYYVLIDHAQALNSRNKMLVEPSINHHSPQLVSNDFIKSHCIINKRYNQWLGDYVP